MTLYCITSHNVVLHNISFRSIMRIKNLYVNQVIATKVTVNMNNNTAESEIATEDEA